MRSARTTTDTRSSFGLFTQIAAILLAVAAPACSGDAGADGANGAPGQDGTDGAPGQDGTDGMEGPKGDPGDSPVVDPSLSPLEKAFVGIGGHDLVAGLTTLQVSTSGTRWLPGEGFSPDDDPLLACTFDLDLSIDLAAGGLRADYQRHLVILGFDTMTTFSEIVSGDVGVVDGVESLFGAPDQADMPSDRWATTWKHHRLLNPQIILHDIANDPALVLDDSGVALLDGSVHHLLVVGDQDSRMTLWVNATTGWIDKLSLLESDPLHRDVEVEVFYYGWGTTGAGGLRFPSDEYVAHDGLIVHQEKRGAITVDAPIPVDTFAFPPGANPMYDADDAARGDATNESHQLYLSGGFTFFDGLQTFVQDTVISPGVHYLTGGSHNSLVIEQANGLVLIEAPLYEQRSEAILSWAATAFPNKPISHVVTTHHHSDHAAGVRTIVAAGATSVISELTVDFWKDVFQAPSQVIPDALELNPVAFAIQPVADGGSFTIPDAGHPVTVFAIETPHATDMLIAYDAAAQVVFQSDLINPGNPLFIPPPFAMNALSLYTGLMDLGIASPTLKIVGGHGAGPNTFAELQAALGL
jgi:glyoxylase-like metal-dependent hydrolase (beta-lactamase superfamily II)